MSSFLINESIWIILIVFTIYLVIRDRAFSKQIRNYFCISLMFCLVLCTFEHLESIYGEIGEIQKSSLLFIIGSVLRPTVLFFLASVNLYNLEVQKIIRWLLGIPVLINIPICILGFYNIQMVILGFYVFLLFASALIEVKKRGKSESAFIITSFVMLVVAFAKEFNDVNALAVSNYLSLMTCLWYYYLVMRTYKRDGLTGLFIRHNLNFELEDLRDRVFDIVLVDVDNFKLINDKYGHEKGDEALVTIVGAINKGMPRGCKFYRFGGDEFVIISRKVTSEQLKQSFDAINVSLEKDDLHISFGIVRHEKGDNPEETMAAADKAMYENKRALKSESIWDDMTGLFNYRGFLDELGPFRKMVKRNGNVVCLIGVDVERLNDINLAYGYTEGNIVIEALSRMLKTNLRGRDFIGHLGSDEFVVAIEVSGYEDEYVDQFVNSVIEGMDVAYELAGRDYTVKLNFGKYFIMKDNDKTPEVCVNTLLYIKQEDKENRRKTDVGEDGQGYNEEDNKQVLDILDNNRLKYAFQPIVSAKDGHIEAYETLMRSDTEVMVSPLKILKYAEKNNRIYDVEKYTLNNVLSSVSKMSSFPEGRRIFINSIPGFHLTERDFGELVNSYGQWFKRVVIEITEQREIDEEALVALNTRRDKCGFSVAIDDYGSGCSNTNSILRYTPEVIKLDRLLITGIDKNAKKQYFVNSIITFAKENDMQILAEGVETESELKTVIRLGVDFIQGYFTARPSFDIIDEIPEDIRKIIINENLTVGSNPRKVYTAASDGKLSVVHLAMEDYTRINVSAKYLTITGSSEYTADLCIRIKEGLECNLTLADVKINSVDDLPCIDMGLGSKLNLRLEGNSQFNARGIHVPEGCTLTVSGPGNIDIAVKGHDCYAIGGGYDESMGNLIFENTGTINIVADGEKVIGIGAGIYNVGQGIEIKGGVYKITVAGVTAAGIGGFKGDVPVNISSCAISMDFKVSSGSAIGSVFGNQNITLKNYNLDIIGSGSIISAIGSGENSGGKIDISSGTARIKMNGHMIYLIGAKEGQLCINIDHSRLKFLGEGDAVIGFGTLDKKGQVSIIECSTEVVINASSPLAFGAEEANMVLEGPLTVVRVNGSTDFKN